MMENEEDNDFIGGTSDDDDTAPPMENEVNNDFIGIGGTGDDNDTAPPPLGARIEVNTDVIGGTGNDNDNTALPPLVARSHNVLQQLDDAVLNMRRHPWRRCSRFVSTMSRWVMMHRLLAHLWS